MRRISRSNWSARNIMLISGNVYFWQLARKLFGSSLIGYWRLMDSVGSATANNIVNNVGATATAITFGIPGIGDGATAASFDGTNSLIDIYSAYLNTNHNKEEFTIALWFKVSDVGVWTDATARTIIRLWSDANNYMQIYRSATNGELDFDFKFNATLVNKKLIGIAPTGWIHIGLTCSKSNNRLRWYLDGTQRWVDQVGFDSWINNLLDTRCTLGSGAVPVSNPWSGLLAHVVIANREATPSEMRELAYGQTKDKVVFFGDSIVNGTGASDDAHTFRKLICASRGWTDINAGLGGTLLQNTIQNTIATIGGATDNNGRDTYSSRVIANIPNWVFILYGTNDIRLNDVAITVAEYTTDLGVIVDFLIASGVPPTQIVIGSPPYMNAACYAAGAPIWNGGSAAKHADYVVACAAVAAAKGTTYIDVYQWMADNGGDALLDAGNPPHPNDAGHAAIANAFLSVI